MTMEKADETGTIEPGKPADFIVIDQNILEVPVDKIHKTRVLRTVLQGHTVYEARWKQNHKDPDNEETEYEDQDPCTNPFSRVFSAVCSQRICRRPRR